MIKLFHTTITGRTVFCSKRPHNLKKNQHEIVRNRSKQRSMGICNLCLQDIYRLQSKTIKRRQREPCMLHKAGTSFQQVKQDYLSQSSKEAPTTSFNLFKTMPHAIQYLNLGEVEKIEVDIR